MAVYLVNSVTRRNITLLLAIIPLGVTKRTGEFDIAFIQFDEQERVRRFGIGTGYAQGKLVGRTLRPVQALEYGARKWLAENEESEHRR